MLTEEERERQKMVKDFWRAYTTELGHTPQGEDEMVKLLLSFEQALRKTFASTLALATYMKVKSD